MPTLSSMLVQAHHVPYLAKSGIIYKSQLQRVATHVENRAVYGYECLGIEWEGYLDSGYNSVLITTSVPPGTVIGYLSIAKSQWNAQVAWLCLTIPMPAMPGLMKFNSFAPAMLWASTVVQSLLPRFDP